jgi:2-oxoglutarate dehydrogenase complex dehydrogenase (E1) component-like enzyme
LLIHGDAAISGQGVVYELLNLSRSRGTPRRHGAHGRQQHDRLHDAARGRRSSRYCTDIAKMINAPVLHVNGRIRRRSSRRADGDRVPPEVPEGRVHRHVVLPALRAQRAGRGVVHAADHGALIKKKTSTLKVYAERLLAEGVLDDAT